MDATFLTAITPSIGYIMVGLVVLTIVPIGGWIFTTWLRVKNGYPLENAWGKAIYPQLTNETTERIKLLSGENAQLRAELSAIKERLATVERIVTDSSFRLDREIDALRGSAN